jgi:hypothetical protein
MNLMTCLEREFGSSNPLTNIYGNFGTERGALLYTQLFVPPTCVICDWVFLEYRGALGDQEFETDRRKIFCDRSESLDNLSEVVGNFNWIDLGDLLGGQDYCRSSFVIEHYEECLMAIALTVRESWSAVLKQRYDSRVFKVSVLEEDVTGNTIGVGFEEIR